MPRRRGTSSATSLNGMRTAEGGPRILITRLGAMGDVLHTLPAAADLRLRFPRGRIAWAVDSKWAPLLRGNPHIDEAISVPLGRWRRSKLAAATWSEISGFVREFRTAGFDLAFDFQGLLKSAICCSLSGAPVVIGFDRSLLRERASELLYDRRAPASSPHVVDRYRELAWFGSGRAPSSAAEFPLPRGDWSIPLPEHFVLGSPQAGWGSKQWPRSHYSALARTVWREHGMPLVADCPPGQRACVEEIRAGAPQGAVITHESTIPQLIAATRRATAVVGVDSGPLHMATALGKRGVAIFGPTDPLRNGPYGPSIAVIREPTALTTYERSPRPSESMRACDPDLVYSQLRPLLTSVHSKHA